MSCQKMSSLEDNTKEDEEGLNDFLVKQLYLLVMDGWNWLKLFSQKEKMSSLDVYGLKCLVRSYNALEWLDKLQYCYIKWLKVIGKTKEELEKENHCLKPSVLEEIADQHGKVMEDAKTKFLQMKTKFPERKYVKYLKQLDEFYFP